MTRVILGVTASRSTSTPWKWIGALRTRDLIEEDVMRTNEYTMEGAKTNMKNKISENEGVDRLF